MAEALRDEKETVYSFISAELVTVALITDPSGRVVKKFVSRAIRP
jgi:hypothetical protein